MISRVTMRKIGLADYLKSGHRKDSNYKRQEKDNVKVLYGNLNNLKEAEIYTNKYKKWKQNYEHIVIGFSKEDMQILDKLKEEDRQKALEEIAEDYIKHRTSGYDLKTEIIAYSEVHKPKIKEEFGKERLEHIHIGISYLNPTNNTKIRTPFFNNSFISDTIDKYVALKNNLTFANTKKRIEDKPKNIVSDITDFRKKLKEDLKNIKSEEELIKYLNNNNLEYRKVKNKYYKIINKDGKNINLQGIDFNHLTNIKNKGNVEELKNKNIEELKEILDKFYEQRTREIEARRSVKTKENLAKEKNEQQEQKKNEYSLSNTSYQENIFYKKYGTSMQNNFNLKDYYIDTKEADKTKFINKEKKINIEDIGDKIISNTSEENLQERVKLMLNIATAKKWNLAEIKINGSENFKVEVERQIAEILLKKEQDVIKKDVVKKEIERPTTITQQYKKEAEEKKEQIKVENDVSLQVLKENLDATFVLDFAINKYKINKIDYIIEDNKIKNINSKNKAKNAIDFLKLEVNLDIKESIEICRELYKQNPKKIEVVTPPEPEPEDDDYPTIPEPKVVTPPEPNDWDDYPTIPEPKVVTPPEPNDWDDYVKTIPLSSEISISNIYPYRSSKQLPIEDSNNKVSAKNILNSVQNTIKTPSFASFQKKQEQEEPQEQKKEEEEQQNIFYNL